MDKEPIIDIDEIEKNLEPTKKEAVQTVLLAVAETAIPLSGGIIRIFDSAFDSSTKRSKETIILIGKGLLELDKRIDNFNIENLEGDEHFKALIMRSIQISMSNSEEEKIEYLRNGILNSALGISTEKELQSIFLDYINTFSVLHIRLLDFFNTPKSKPWIENLVKVFVENSGYNIDRTEHTIRFPSGEVYWQIFPELEGKWYLIDNALRDLTTKGLIIVNEGNPMEITLETGEMIPQIQELGKMFLSYINNPKQLE
jgi:hypothetical protein